MRRQFDCRRIGLLLEPRGMLMNPRNLSVGELAEWSELMRQGPVMTCSPCPPWILPGVARTALT